MPELSKRIKKFRKYIDVSQAVFAFSLGVNQGHISKIERGLANPSNQLIKLICKTYEINEEWLREEKGNMSQKPPLTDEQVEDLAIDFKKGEYRHLKYILEMVVKDIERSKNYLSKFTKPKKPKGLFDKMLAQVNIQEDNLLEMQNNLHINELKTKILLKIEELKQLVFYLDI